MLPVLEVAELTNLSIQRVRVLKKKADKGA
jgi:hypothetical protein